jgi:hypothetical protein
LAGWRSIRGDASPPPGSSWAFGTDGGLDRRRVHQTISTIGSITQSVARIDCAREAKSKDRRFITPGYPHSTPTLPSTSRPSLKVLPFLVAVPRQIPKASLCSPCTFEYPRASNRNFASPSVKPVAGPIDRDNGTDGSVGDDRVACARAELATKLNMQVATRGGTRIASLLLERVKRRSLLERVKRRSVILSPVIRNADSPNRRNNRARPHRRELRIATMADAALPEGCARLCRAEWHQRRP